MMPLFFFDTSTPTGFTTDELGVDLRDVQHARSEAIKGARSLMAECLLAGRPIGHERFVVRGDDGTVAFELPFREALVELLPGIRLSSCR